MSDNIIKTDGGDNILELQLNVLIVQEDAFYIALCPSLGLSSYGDSIEDAKEGFNEVMRAYIEDTGRMGPLSKDLESRGWQILIKQRKVVPPENIELDIPAGILKQQFNQSWAIAV